MTRHRRTVGPRRSGEPGRGGTDGSADRPDAYELAVARAAETERADDQGPPLPSGRQGRRVMSYVVLAGVAAAVARGGLAGHAPAVPGSCSDPVLALYPAEVRAQGSVRWALSGPKDTQVVLALDATAPPSQTDPGWLAGPLPLRDCRARGAFGAGLAGGRHQVRVFVVGPGPVRVLTSQALTVDSRR